MTRRFFGTSMDTAHMLLSHRYEQHIIKTFTLSDTYYHPTSKDIDIIFLYMTVPCLYSYWLHVIYTKCRLRRSWYMRPIHVYMGYIGHIIWTITGVGGTWFYEGRSGVAPTKHISDGGYHAASTESNRLHEPFKDGCMITCGSPQWGTGNVLWNYFAFFLKSIVKSNKIFAKLTIFLNKLIENIYFSKIYVFS